MSTQYQFVNYRTVPFYDKLNYRLRKGGAYLDIKELDFYIREVCTHLEHRLLEFSTPIDFEQCLISTVKQWVDLRVVKTTLERVNSGALRPNTFFQYLEKGQEINGCYINKEVRYIYELHMSSFKEFLKSTLPTAKFTVLVEDVIEAQSAKGTLYQKALLVTEDCKFIAFHWDSAKLIKGQLYDLAVAKNSYTKANGKMATAFNVSGATKSTIRRFRASNECLLNLGSRMLSEQIDLLASFNVNDVVLPEVKIKKIKSYESNNKDDHSTLVQLMGLEPLTATVREWTNSNASTFEETPVYEAKEQDVFICKNLSLGWYYSEKIKAFNYTLSLNPFSRIQAVKL